MYFVLFQVHSWSRLDYTSQHAKDLAVPAPPSYIELNNQENKVGDDGLRKEVYFVFGTSLCILEVIRDSNLFHDFFLNSCDSHRGGQRHLRGLQQTLLRKTFLNDGVKQYYH